MDMKKEIEAISDFARVRVFENEMKGFVRDFERILDYFGKIGDISSCGRRFEQGSNVHLREDRIERSSSIAKKGTYYRVPKII